MADSHENVLPPAIQKQVDEADAIIARLNAGEDAQPKKQKADPQPEPKQEADPQPEPEPEPKSEPKSDWKHKYSVLQGKYDAEVPRLNDELRQTRSEYRNLQDKVQSLETMLASMKALQDKPAQPPQPSKPLVTQEEIDTYGPDLIDIVGRVAKQVLEPYVDERVGRIEKDVKQVGENVASTQKTVAKSAREKLYERLDSRVPEWRTINKQQEFVSWLNELDPYTGVPRGANLRAAFDRNDSDRVLAFFEGFQKEHAVATEDPNPAAPSEEAPKEEGPQQKLDTLVAPGTPKTGTTGAQEESGKGRIWTRKMISDFYEQKNELIKANPNRDLPKEVEALERDLFKAQAEGRLRN